MVAQTRTRWIPQKLLSVRNRLLILVLVSILIPVAITQYVALTTTQTSLKENIDETFYSLASVEARSQVGLFEGQLNLINGLASDSILQQAALAQDASYSDNPEENLAALAAFDEQWTAAVTAGNTDEPLIRDTMTGRANDRLLSFVRDFPAYTEVFITDAYGGLIATTLVTSDYYQADEDWWTAAWNNSQGAMFIDAQITYDESSNTYGLRMAVPIRGSDGKAIGVLRTTYNLADLQARIADFRFGKTGHMALVTQTGLILFSPRLTISDQVTLPDLVPLLARPYNQRDGKLDVVKDESGERSVMASAAFTTNGATPTVDDLRWSVAIFKTEEETLDPVNTVLTSTLPVAVIVILLALGATYWLTRTITIPLRRLTETAQQMSQTGNWNLRTTVTGEDELGELGRSFNTMAASLKDAIGLLEARVQARTKDLQLAAQVSEHIASILDVEQLLPQVVELTRENFDLYHSHIYLLDETRSHLVLAAGAGEPGRIMKMSKHSIPAGTERSLVARAAQHNNPVIVDDVTREPGFLPNPLLPNTRSEAAFPLAVGERVFGVLDVQSEQVARFDADLLAVLSTLAGQVAVALDNARLFTEVENTSRHEQALGTIAQRIQQATSVDDVLQTAVRELGVALRVPHTAIELRLPAHDAPLTAALPARPEPADLNEVKS